MFIFRIILLFQVCTAKCLHALMSRNHVVFLTLSVSQSCYMLMTRLSYQEGGGDGWWSFRGGLRFNICESFTGYFLTRDVGIWTFCKRDTTGFCLKETSGRFPDVFLRQNSRHISGHVCADQYGHFKPKGALIYLFIYSFFKVSPKKHKEM